MVNFKSQQIKEVFAELDKVGEQSKSRWLQLHPGNTSALPSREHRSATKFHTYTYYCQYGLQDKL